MSKKDYMKSDTFEDMSEEDFESAMQDSLMDGTVTAMCIHCCIVEPDGWCPHGNPSPLIHMGMI